MYERVLTIGIQFLMAGSLVYFLLDYLIEKDSDSNNSNNGGRNGKE